MTVEELIDWLESAKRIASESGQRIDEYIVVRPDGFSSDGQTIYGEIDPSVDHGQDIVTL